MSAGDVKRLDVVGFGERLQPVYEALGLIRDRLPSETTLLGFCGAPWTVATYMIAGQGTPDQAPTRLFGYREPEAFGELLDVLADMSGDYLARQVEAGADAVQVFDSWSGVLDEVAFEDWCVRPVARLVKRFRQRHPDVPVIGFPRGAGALYDSYRQRTGVTALGLDWSVPLSQAKRLQREGAVQGNLDPLRLVAGGKALEDGVIAILDELGEGPLIFNLGHGITPDTPVGHVQQMVQLVRKAGR
jgi:uroporphyrinogen decarboxylase